MSKPIRMAAVVLAAAIFMICGGPAAAAAASVAPPATVDVRTDVQYGEANGKRLLLDAYVPAAAADGERRPAVLLFHGGGFRAGDKRSFAPEARKLANKGWVAFSVNYRLDEPAAFPAEIEDAQAAVRWVRATADQYRIDPKRIGALGESAGGHLTAMLATLGQGSQSEGARIRAGVAWSGPMDLTALARQRGDQWGASLVGCGIGACPQKFADASPITHVDGTDSPLFIINSTEELVPREQAVRMATRIEDEGGVTQLQIIPGTRHALDYRDEVWPQTELFLEKQLAPPETTSAGSRVFAVTLVVIVAGAAALIWRRRASADRRKVAVPA